MPSPTLPSPTLPSPTLPKSTLSDASVTVVDKPWSGDTSDITKTCDRLSDSPPQLNCVSDDIDDTVMKTAEVNATSDLSKSVSASSSAPELTGAPKDKTSRESEYSVYFSSLSYLLCYVCGSKICILALKFRINP